VLEAGLEPRGKGRGALVDPRQHDVHLQPADAPGETQDLRPADLRFGHVNARLARPRADPHRAQAFRAEQPAIRREDEEVGVEPGTGWSRSRQLFNGGNGTGTTGTTGTGTTGTGTPGGTGGAGSGMPTSTGNTIFVFVAGNQYNTLTGGAADTGGAAGTGGAATGGATAGGAH